MLDAARKQEGGAEKDQRGGATFLPLTPGTYRDGDHGSVSERRHHNLLQDVLLQTRPQFQFQFRASCDILYVTRRLTHRGHVYGRRGFVHDEDAALSDKRSGQTEELPLTDAEVLSAFRHDRIWTEANRW